MTGRCNICGKVRVLRKRNVGSQQICKICCKTASAEWYKEFSEYNRQYQMNYDRYGIKLGRSIPRRCNRNSDEKWLEGTKANYGTMDKVQKLKNLFQ